MTTTTTEAINRELQHHGRNTIEQFHERVNEVIRRHSPQNDLTEVFEKWRDDDYSVAYLYAYIRPALVHLRGTLSQKQYRCDGDIEQLEIVRRAMLDGSAAQHVLDTIYARVFVDWCDTFTSLSREEVSVH